MNTSAAQPAVRGAIVVAAVLLVVATLYFGREILIPFALATLFAFLLAPAVRQVERLRIGRVSAVMCVVSAALVVAGLIGWLITLQAVELVEDLPRHRRSIVEKVRSVRETLSGRVSAASETVEEISAEIRKPIDSRPATQPGGKGEQPTNAGQRETGRRDASAPPPLLDPLGDGPMAPLAGGAQPSPNAVLASDEPVKVELVPPRQNILLASGTYLGPVVPHLVTAGITAILLVFFLIFREEVRDRVIRLAGRAHINTTTTALTDSASRVTRYLIALTLANAINGVVTGLGLFVLGIPNAFLWGLISGLMRYVPFLGPWIAAVFPVALSAATAELWFEPLLVLGWMLSIDLLSGNLIEPWLYGRRTGASPVAIVFAYVFWTWIWGPIGLFLAMPITVCLVVLGKHVPAFEAFYVLFGDEPVLEPATRFYQRLLAKDEWEAREIALQYAAARSSVAVLDDVILPALAQLELDRRQGVLERERTEHARDAVERILTQLEAPAAPRPEPDETHAGPLVLVTTGSGAFDRLLPTMFAKATAPRALRLANLPPTALATDIALRVRDDQPAALVFLAVEPRSTHRLRLIARRLEQEGLTPPLHAGLFGVGIRAADDRNRSRNPREAHIWTALARLAEALPAARSGQRQVETVSEAASGGAR